MVGNCFVRRWAYAIYCIVMIGVFVAGMPVGIYAALSRHKYTLFGPASHSTQRRLGFLYEMYDPNRDARLGVCSVVYGWCDGVVCFFKFLLSPYVIPQASQGCRVSLTARQG